MSRVARALEALPATSEAMAKGRSALCAGLCAARALTRVATPENEVELLEAADGCTVAKLEKMVRAYRVGSAEDEAERERRQWDSRTLSVFPDPSPAASGAHDGMYVVSGRLTAEVGALLMRAIDAASDALYAAQRPNPLASEKERLKAAAQRRADALRLLAERGPAVGFGGLAVGFGGPAVGFGGPAVGFGGPAREGAEEASADRGSRGSEDACGGHPPPAPISGSRAERYQVLRIDASALASPENVGRRHLHDGTGVSYETSRRLTYDAAIVPMFESSHGELLDMGRRTRTLSPALRRALEARDGGCRFPDHSPAASGARGARFTDAHHMRHWADGGETSLSNTLLLCWYHHRLVHEPDGPVPIEVEDRFAAAVFEGSP